MQRRDCFSVYFWCLSFMNGYAAAQLRRKYMVCLTDNVIFLFFIFVNQKSIIIQYIFYKQTGRVNKSHYGIAIILVSFQ